VKTIWLALLPLALLPQAPPAGPLASLPATLRPLRDHLEENKPTFGATAALTAAKHQLRDWIESQLPAAPGEAVDVQALAGKVHGALAEAGLLCNDLQEQCDWNFLGYVDDVRVTRAGDFLVLVTAMGIRCGYDESAYVYARGGRSWRRVWEHERTVYTESGYLPQMIHDVQISAPDAGGDRLLMTLGSQTICGGAFKDLYARVWSVDADFRAAAVLDWKAHANDAYPPIQGRVRPNDVLFQFTTGGLLSGEVHTAVRHFAVERGTARQIDPIASLPRDFVVEWLSAPWDESRSRTESAALAARHAESHRDDGVGDFPESTTRCGTASDLWQVVTHLYERPKRYFRVRWQDPFRFTLMDVSDKPYADCTVSDSRGETYADLLGPPR
jgi:hypothetical protein